MWCNSTEPSRTKAEGFHVSLCSLSYFITRVLQCAGAGSCTYDIQPAVTWKCVCALSFEGDPGDLWSEQSLPPPWIRQVGTDNLHCCDVITGGARTSKISDRWWKGKLNKHLCLIISSLLLINLWCYFTGVSIYSPHNLHKSRPCGLWLSSLRFDSAHPCLEQIIL